jgi:hypothetical protein
MEANDNVAVEEAKAILLAKTILDIRMEANDNVAVEGAKTILAKTILAEKAKTILAEKLKTELAKEAKTILAEDGGTRFANICLYNSLEMSGDAREGIEAMMTIYGNLMSLHG